MSLYAKLQERAAQGRPLRVGLIGAGKFGAMYLAQVPKTPGVHLAAIADLSPAARDGQPRARRLERRALRRAIARCTPCERHDPRRRRLAGAGAASADRHRRRVHGQSDRGGRALPAKHSRKASTWSTSPSRPMRSAGRCWRASGRGGRRLQPRFRRSAGADLRPGRLGARRGLRCGRRRAAATSGCRTSRNRRRKRSGATTG